MYHCMLSRRAILKVSSFEICLGSKLFRLDVFKFNSVTLIQKSQYSDKLVPKEFLNCLD